MKESTPQHPAVYIGVTEDGEYVRIETPEPCTGITLAADQAEALAGMLLYHAGRVKSQQARWN